MTSIYACFRDYSLAEKAVGALLDHGAHPHDISLIRGNPEEQFRNYRAQQSEGALMDRPAVRYSQFEDTHFRAAERNAAGGYTEKRMEADRALQEMQGDDDFVAKSGISTTTGADAGAGAVKGAGVGLGVGILAALAALFIPGFGLVGGAGALTVAIGGAAGATGAGALAGAVTGYLKDQGMGERVAAEYGHSLEEGGSLLEVRVPSGDVTEEVARRLLDKYGASNIGCYAAQSERYVS